MAPENPLQSVHVTAVRCGPTCSFLSQNRPCLFDVLVKRFNRRILALFGPHRCLRTKPTKHSLFAGRASRHALGWFEQLSRRINRPSGHCKRWKQYTREVKFRAGMVSSRLFDGNIQSCLKTLSLVERGARESPTAGGELSRVDFDGDVVPMVRYGILRTFWLISSRRNIPLKKLRVALTSRPNGFKNKEHDEHQVDDGRADVMKDLRYVFSRYLAWLKDDMLHEKYIDTLREPSPPIELVMGSLRLKKRKFDDPNATKT